MKFPLVSALALFTVLGLSQQAKALNVEACAKNPMTSKPQVINLLQPIDQKFLNCVPGLSSIANEWKSRANRITSATNKFKIGNNGNSKIEKLEYNLAGNYISLGCSAKAAHTWKIKECAIPEMGQTGCDKWVRTPWGKECVQPTFGQTGCKKWLEQPISVSATCTYNYTFNISTGESKPVFSCGRGALGEYKLDASAVTAILRGEMPKMSELLTSVDFTPPLFKDESRDAYHDVRNNMIARHQGSHVYFSSESFVNWASAKNQGANIILTAISGGGYGAEFARQLEQRLRSEINFMGTFASQTAIQLGSEQLASMITGKGSMKLNGFDVSVKVVNTPEVTQKCIIKPRRECMPAIELPRLGFAVIATPAR
ncbi:hypothetical protein OsccyDRAFT_1488 [Leptolyngbyaceae cyanobacterium JSC-12]|nr:hypothetical protein OsccyDRAFT_1488 [Leptolyngbyaceae cyanobacterium JSC-12]